MIRYLLFDFFGTLVDYRDHVLGNPVHRSWEYLRSLGYTKSAEAFAAEWDALWRELDGVANDTLREIHMHDGAEQLLKACALPNDPHTVAQFTRHYIDDWNEGVTDIDGLHAMLDELTQPAAVVSNTLYPPLVPGHIARLGLQLRFDAIYTSVQHGYRKPHASFYQRALSAANCPAGEVLFVGDNRLCDYAAPRQFGMHAVWISATPHPDVPEQHRIARVTELSAWLRSYSP